MQGITTVCKRDERLQLAALEGLKHLIQHKGTLGRIIFSSVLWRQAVP